MYLFSGRSVMLRYHLLDWIAVSVSVEGVAVLPFARFLVNCNRNIFCHCMLYRVFNCLLFIPVVIFHGTTDTTFVHNYGVCFPNVKALTGNGRLPCIRVLKTPSRKQSFSLH